MSKAAKAQIEDELNQDDSQVAFETLAERVSQQQGVSQSTAEAYVRKYADIEVEADGSKVAVPQDASSETAVAEDEDDMLQPIGEPTGDMFSNVEILEKTDHPLIPTNHKDGYYRRRVAGKKTDVQVVTKAIASDNYGTLLIGEAGTGKDRLLQHIAANRNQPCVRVNFNSKGDFVSMLLGHYTPDGDGGFEFKKGLLTLAVENGWMFVADEINAAGGEVLVALNGLLEDKDSRKLVIPETNESITPHEQFTFTATMNPPSYEGTNELNGAFKSRFIPVTLDYIDADAECKVVASDGSNDFDEDDSELEDLVEIANALRDQYKAGELITPITTREILKACEMAEVMGIKNAATEVFTGMAGSEDKSSIESTIQKYKF